MNVSPLDLRQQRFKSTLRGFDKVEVTSFLAAVADDYEQALREAEGRSDLLIEKTQARLEDIQRSIDGLRLKRKDVETTIEAAIQTLRNTLDFVREQEAHDRDERVLLHRPRLMDQPAAAARERTEDANAAAGGR
jgi:DivIVA domain-containing protein